MKKVVIVGLGLIGGSFALALKRIKVVEQIIGVEADEENAIKALSLGLVDEIKSLEEAILDCELVVLATPIDSIEEILTIVLDNISADTIVMDLGSTKQSICERVKNHPKRKNFVATHPIAGTENSGPDSAFAELYLNKVAILCDVENSSDKAVQLVKSIYHSLWMKVICLNSKEHDLHIAYVSHLSHITSFALGQTVLEEEKNESAIFNMAGSGFASTVRLAKSSPDMWTPILIKNKDNLLKAIDSYQKKISVLRDFIAEEDTKGIHNYLNEANDIRRILTEK